MLLIGEAPGYRGAAVTGVPFCSLSILMEDWSDPWGAFGTASRFRACDGSSFWREATATMFWSCLAQVCGDEPMPLTWNAVPFHPRANDLTNRSVLADELRHGVRWLEWLLELFPNVRPIAVGRVASEGLARLGLEHASVRHPSHGGRADFARGVLGLARENGSCLLGSPDDASGRTTLIAP